MLWPQSTTEHQLTKFSDTLIPWSAHRSCLRTENEGLHWRQIPTIRTFKIKSTTKGLTLTQTKIRECNKERHVCIRIHKLSHTKIHGLLGIQHQPEPKPLHKLYPNASSSTTTKTGIRKWTNTAKKLKTAPWRGPACCNRNVTTKRAEKPLINGSVEMIT